MKTYLLLILLLSSRAYAGNTGTWSGSDTHQFFPTIIKVLLGNGYSLIPDQSLYGDGADGGLVVGNSNVTLTRDEYYSSIAWSAAATGQILASNQRIYVSGTCDFTNAPTGAINVNGGNGGNGGAAGAAGSAGSSAAAGALGRGQPGNTGGAGSTTAGAQGTAGSAGTGNGGASGSTGAGGSGGVAGANAGGAGRPVVTPNPAPFKDAFQTVFITGTGSAQVGGGAGGPGGSGGGGDGVSSGGGGGGSGGAGGTVYLSCYHIIFGASTPAGVIESNGGNGGNATTPSGTCTNGCGSGSPGSGSGGGWVMIRYDQKTGTVLTNAIQSRAGTNGSTAAGKGTGGTGAAGGTAPTAGTITLFNMRTGAITTSISGNSTL